MMVSQKVSEMFTTQIKCELYEPMIGKVAYGSEVGIPTVTDSETRAEMGWKYTICSPLSPYALGWKNWQKLVDIAGDKSLPDVFNTKVDFKLRKISVYRVAQ